MQVDVFGQVRKIGSLWCLVALSFGCYGSSIHIAVNSVQGIPLSSVAVGKPFLLVVTIKNPKGIRSLPHIEGLAPFHIAGHSSRSMQNQSGGILEEELSILYTLMAEKPGSYVLGPANFQELPGKKSESLSIEVIEGLKAGKENEFEEPKLTLQLEKSEAYVGEKIPFVLRFSWQDPELKPIHLEIPQLPDVQVKDVSKGTAKTERNGNRVYNILEFNGVLYPERAGVIRIPQLRADYTLPREERRWSNFFPFPLQEREAIFSPSVRLTIHELPPHDTPVVGIGNLRRFAAMISPHEIPRGEAGTLVLSAQGDADFAQLTVPTPDLPPSFRAYPSKTTLERNGKGVQWSYVIQGLEEGTFTIAAQKLTYFDTQSKNYKTLQTKPLSVTVTPGMAMSTPAQTGEEVVQKEDSSRKEEMTKEIPQESRSIPTLPKIPLSLFILLMLLPPLSLLVRFVARVSAPRVKKFMIKRRSQNALKQGAKKLHLLEKKGNAKDVYDVVKSSISEFLGLNDPQDEEIISLLKERGYQEKMRREVARVLEDSLQASPYAEKLTKRPRDLFQRALTVLRTLGTHAMALLISCMAIHSIHGVQSDSNLQKVAIFWEVVPFLILQLGVVIGWWLLWWRISRFSSELRSLIIVVWLVFLVGWVFRLPYELRPLARVEYDVELLVGPSENYPSRGVLGTGDELALVKREGAWYYVSSLEGKGWIPAASIKRTAG